MRAVRPVRIEGDTVFVTLTRGYVARVSIEDVEIVTRWNWAATAKNGNTVYACRGAIVGGKNTTVLLHRAIMQAAHGQHVDHADCDGLNNTRENLRFATHAQNAANTKLSVRNQSGYKGVYWREEKRKWAATIKIAGKSRHLGYFNRVEDARAAYVMASQQAHGEFARAG